MSPMGAAETVCTWTVTGSTTVYIPLHFSSTCEALFQCFGLPARSPQCILSQEPFTPEQREKAGTTRHHHTHLAAWPGAAAAKQASAPGAVSTRPAPTLFKNDLLHKAYTAVTSSQDNFLYNKREKAGEPWALSGTVGVFQSQRCR